MKNRRAPVIVVMSVLAAGVFGSFQSGPSVTQSVSNLIESGTSQATHEISASVGYNVSLPTGSTGSTSTTSQGVRGTTGQGIRGSTGGTGTSTTTGSTSSTTGTTSTTGGTTGYLAYAAIANQGTGYNTDWTAYGVSGSNVNLPITSTGPTVSCNRWSISNSNDLTLVDGMPSNGDTVTTLREVVQGYVVGQTILYNHWYWRTDYKLYKVPFNAISVDSRLINGQPDLDGEVQGDPNADPKNANFSGWTFNGGLFVGNAPWTSGDQSGTARVQLSATSFPTFINPAATDLSMVAMGQPSAFTGSFSAGTYPAAANDPNLNQNQQTVTWATGWNLPSGQPTLGAALSSSTTPGQYVSIPAAPQNDLILAVTDESNFVQNFSAGWMYFATPAYASALGLSAYPFNDCQPRMWVLDDIYNASWSTTGDTSP